MANKEKDNNMKSRIEALTKVDLCPRSYNPCKKIKVKDGQFRTLFFEN